MSASDFEARLRAIGAERYHHRHPFNLRMHAGELSRDGDPELGAQPLLLPDADPDQGRADPRQGGGPGFRRGWVRRIRDHDGDAEREGGLALWLELAEAVGLEPRAT